MAMRNGAIKLVAGNSNPALAEAIAGYLKTRLTQAVVRRFADMEIFVEIQENVRGADVFVIQSTSSPTNDHLMELLIIIDAAAARVRPARDGGRALFGYAGRTASRGRARRFRPSWSANLITHAGADRVMTLDLHAGQIQGFFDIPTDNLYAAPMMVRDIKERFDLDRLMVVSPDVGGVARRARARQADRCAARDRRQAARARRRIRGHERNRRGRRPYLHPGRRHHRFLAARW